MLCAQPNLGNPFTLSQAYKIAKVNAAKRKEARERWADSYSIYTYIEIIIQCIIIREKATAQPEVENGSLQSIILEGDEEDSDDQEAFADDEDEAEVGRLDHRYYISSCR